MTKSQKVRRLIENESIFRKYNEQVNAGLKREIKKEIKNGGAISENHLDVPLHFFCECSDENCTERIIIKPSLYGSIHNNRKRFIVLPNHNVENIEKKITVTKEYIVVEKYESAPEKPKKLNKTSVDNSGS